MEQIEEDVLELVKEGYSFKKISKELNMKEKEVLTLKNKMLETGKLTKQDIEEGKCNLKRKRLEENENVNLILKYKRQGISDNQISRRTDLKMTQSQISDYVRRCVKLGLITDEEIEIAREQRNKENKEKDPNRIRILEGLRRGEIDTVIAKDTNISYAQVKNIRIELINEGIITQEEIDIAREKLTENKKNEKVFIEIDKEVLINHLILGYDIYDTRYKVGNVDPDLYARLIKELIKEKRITKEEINKYRLKREEEYKKRILSYLKGGMSQRKIAEIMRFSLDRTQTYIKKLKEEMNISDEQIKEWKSIKADSVNKKRTAVLGEVTKGLSRREIIEAYPEQNLTDSDVKNYIRKLKEEGTITEEEVIKYRKLRNEQNKILSFNEKTVLRCLKSGHSTNEISKIIKKSTSYTFALIRNIKNRGYITDEQIRRAREERANKKELSNFTIIKSKIERIIRLDIKFTKDEEDKIKEYIFMCFSVYRESKAPKGEIELLGKAISKVPIRYEDIVKFTELCIRSREYNIAYRIIRDRKTLKLTTSIPKMEEKLIELENNLMNACKVQSAIQMINKGNTNTGAISEVTGLSNDKINILKIRLSKKDIKFLSISNRERVIQSLIQNKCLEKFYREREMSVLKYKI